MAFAHTVWKHCDIPQPVRNDKGARPAYARRATKFRSVRQNVLMNTEVALLGIHGFE